VPEADRVDLVLGSRRQPMARVGGEWFRAETEIAGGTDYLLAVDGGEPRPDPRSPWQPQGPHGPSRAVDHSHFEWTDGRWRGFPLAEAVVYELHVGTFSKEGTFDGILTHLDHLVNLGVNAIELMPVAEFSGERGWGYDGVDLYAPHHAYGGPDGLKRVVDACHARGLAVILDVVYNHLGPSGNYLGEFGPYSTDRYATPWGPAMNLDGADSDEVRRFIVDNALMWLRDYHLDGLRIDAVHAIVDTSAVHILEQLAMEVGGLEAELSRSLWLIAESGLNDPRLVRPRDVGGYGLDAQWSDDFHHALHAVLTGERTGYYMDFGRVTDIAAALEKAFVYDRRYSSYRRRSHGRPTTGLAGHSFLAYAQDHDQIGNRASGERLSHLVSQSLLKVAAALVLTSPFVPMLFQGEEWGAESPFLYFTDHREEELGRAVGEGRRREFEAFGWEPQEIPDPQDPQSFELSKLHWDEIESKPHTELLEWHRRLIDLRRQTPDLKDGRMSAVRTAFDDDGRWLIVKRGRIPIACNFSGSPRTVPLSPARASRVLLASAREPHPKGHGLELPPESATIFSS
jgi:maltooligosyltrehalose trehalohydrolase